MVCIRIEVVKDFVFIVVDYIKGVKEEALVSGGSTILCSNDVCMHTVSFDDRGCAYAEVRGRSTCSEPNSYYIIIKICKSEP